MNIYFTLTFVTTHSVCNTPLRQTITWRTENRIVYWSQSYVCIPDDPRLSSAAPSNPAYTYRIWDRPHPAYTRIDRFPDCRCRTRCQADCSRINSDSPRRLGRARRFSHPDNSRATNPRTLPPEYRELKKKHVAVSVAETFKDVALAAQLLCSWGNHEVVFRNFCHMCVCIKDWYLSRYI